MSGKASSAALTSLVSTSASGVPIWSANAPSITAGSIVVVPVTVMRSTAKSGL